MCVCVHVHVCIVRFSVKTSLQSASVSGAVECDVCKFVIGLVDKYIIDNNATEVCTDVAIYTCTRMYVCTYVP